MDHVFEQLEELLFDDMLLDEMAATFVDDEDEYGAQHQQQRNYRPASIRTVNLNANAGANEVEDLLEKSEANCFDTTRLTQPVLKALIKKLVDDGLLEDGREIKAAEKVIITL